MTKNKQLIDKVLEAIDSYLFAQYQANKLLEELKNAKLTRTEIKNYGTKQNLIDALESILL